MADAMGKESMWACYCFASEVLYSHGPPIVFGTCYCLSSGTPHSYQFAANQRCAFYFRPPVAMTTWLTQQAGRGGRLLASQIRQARVVPQPSSKRFNLPLAYLIALHAPSPRRVLDLLALAGIRTSSFVTTLRLTPR